MNRPTHSAVGALTGASAIALTGDKNDPWFAFDLLVAAGAGSFGGTLPDRLEPAEHPHHRGAAHGLVAAGSAGVASQRGVALLAQARRASNDLLRQAAITEGWQGMMLTILALAARSVGVAAVAIPAGYVSHIALDASTARSVPLLARRL